MRYKHAPDKLPSRPVPSRHTHTSALQSLAEAKNRVAEAEAEAADAKVEAENLRRRFGVAGDGSAAEAATGARRAGEVEEADLAAMEEKDR